MIPTHIRRTENLHIVFWLVKDMCWIADLRWLGIAMIAPTLIISLWMTWRMRRTASELAHNVAVTSWICANSIWMIGEFYYDDGTRPLAKVFFVIGISVLAIYYGASLLRRTGILKGADTDQASQ